MRITIAIAAVVGIGFIASPTFAATPLECGFDRCTPKKANKWQATVVEGMEACPAGSATTTTGGVANLPACAVTPSDTVCTFGIKKGKLKGKGKMQAKAKKGDIKLKAKLVNLTDTCNGETLCLVASFRTTQEECDNGDECTAVDQFDFPLGVACCQVEKNKCKIKTTVNTALPGAVNPNNNPSFALLGAGFARSGSGTIPFRSGIMVEFD